MPSRCSTPSCKAACGCSPTTRCSSRCRTTACSNPRRWRKRTRPVPRRGGGDFRFRLRAITCTASLFSTGRSWTFPMFARRRPSLPNGAKNFLKSGYRAVTIVPMMRGDAAIGALSVVRLAPGPLSDKQLAVAQELRRPGGHRHRERAAAQRVAPAHRRSHRVAGAADRDARGAARHIEFAGDLAAGVPDRCCSTRRASVKRSSAICG